MCGIAGLVHGRPAQEALERLRRMVAQLAHRGPDGLGVDAFDGAALGHTRLSIVDLVSGDQPMRDATGSCSIVFNGEIYGYEQLRRELDYPFRTSSDTEAILALYRAHGTAMLARLPGMFAFAIWDARERMLFAARDRFGEKPLYYARTDGGELVFASELKAVLASGLVRPRLSRPALAHFLNRLYVPVGESIYATVQQLRPGHALTFKDGELRTWRYWDLPKGATEPIATGDAAEELQRLLRGAIAKQLVADVEVGAFLSGGLDSSTVVTVAAELAPRIRTFSFGFTQGASELHFARDVAAACGTRHTELHDGEARLADLVEGLAQVYDEPFADSSAVPTYMISRLAASQLKVVLTGDGADELLGGYPWYREVWHHRALERAYPLRNVALHAVLRLARRLVPATRPHIQERVATLNRHRRGVTAGQAYLDRTEFVTTRELQAAGLEPPARQLPASTDSLDAVFRSDVGDYLPGDILVKTDRAAMAHGLELRAPFLDVDLASFCLSLPSRLKLDDRRDKLLLREAFSDRWPPALRRRGKQGFAAPVASWLARPDLRELRDACVEAPSARRQLAELIGEELRARLAAEHSDRGWALLVLGVWLRGRQLEL